MKKLLLLYFFTFSSILFSQSEPKKFKDKLEGLAKFKDNFYFVDDF